MESYIASLKEQYDKGIISLAEYIDLVKALRTINSKRRRVL